MKYMLASILALINPAYWFSNHKTCYRYDRLLRNELKNPIFTDIGLYTCKLNGKEVWISNYPYAFGSPGSGLKNTILPRRSTRIILKYELDKAVIENGLKEWV